MRGERERVNEDEFMLDHSVISIFCLEELLFQIRNNFNSKLKPLLSLN